MHLLRSFNELYTLQHLFILKLILLRTGHQKLSDDLFFGLDDAPLVFFLFHFFQLVYQTSNYIITALPEFSRVEVDARFL